MSGIANFFVDNMNTITIFSILIICSLSLFEAISGTVRAYRLHKENKRLREELKKIRLERREE